MGSDNENESHEKEEEEEEDEEEEEQEPNEANPAVEGPDQQQLQPQPPGGVPMMAMAFPSPTTANFGGQPVSYFPFAGGIPQPGFPFPVMNANGQPFFAMPTAAAAPTTTAAAVSATPHSAHKRKTTATPPAGQPVPAVHVMPSNAAGGAAVVAAPPPLHPMIPIMNPVSAVPGSSDPAGPTVPPFGWTMAPAGVPQQQQQHSPPFAVMSFVPPSGTDPSTAIAGGAPPGTLFWAPTAPPAAAPPPGSSSSANSSTTGAKKTSSTATNSSGKKSSKKKASSGENGKKDKAATSAGEDPVPAATGADGETERQNSLMDKLQHYRALAAQAAVPSSDLPENAAPAGSTHQEARVAAGHLDLRAAAASLPTPPPGMQLVYIPIGTTATGASAPGGMPPILFPAAASAASIVRSDADIPTGATISLMPATGESNNDIEEGSGGRPKKKSKTKNKPDSGETETSSKTVPTTKDADRKRAAESTADAASSPPPFKKSQLTPSCASSLASADGEENEDLIKKHAPKRVLTQEEKEEATRKWEEMFQRLEKLAEGTNGVIRNLHENKDHHDLAAWLQEQKIALRSENNEVELSATQIAKLAKLCPDLLEVAASKEECRWEEMFTRLAEFKEIYGHTKVPTRYKEDTRLGQWVSKQRRIMKDMENGVQVPRPLTKKQTDLLDSLNFEWNGRRPGINHEISVIPVTDEPSRQQKRWDEMYQRLLHYKNEHGHTRVPISYDIGQLGSWVSGQRRLMSKKMRGMPSGQLDQKRIDKLNEIGFDWVVGPRRSTDGGGSATSESV